MDEIDESTCLGCGACCVSDYDADDYVLLRDEEVERLEATGRAHMVYEERTYGKPMCSMRTGRDTKGHCRCIALSGVIGKLVACSIYRFRPDVCRKFAPGSANCQAARQIVFGVSDK